jgi:hypothetical protein
MEVEASPVGAWKVDSSDMFDDIPVGIREFMKTEKKLKMMQKKAQEAAA